MSQTIEELTVNYEENGVLAIKETKKVILSKGAWSTLMFEYLTWDPKTNDYKPEPAFTIRRYQKRGGQYFLKSKFNISNKKQAQQILDTLSEWIKED